MCADEEKDERKRVDKKQCIDVLLAEYKACYYNRDHYDSVRWTMGSIFIAASLALFGFSFQEEINRDLVALIIVGIFSMLLMGIWLGYNLHIQPWIYLSMKRIAEIEEKLRSMNFDTSLHTKIQKEDKKEKREGKGRWIFLAIMLLLFSSWIVRITFYLWFQPWSIILLLCVAFVVSALLFKTVLRMHMH